MSGNHVEVAVGAPEIVHALHVGIADGDFEIEVGTFGIWSPDEGDFGGAAAHEFAARATGHRAFFVGLVAEIIYLQIKVVPKNTILGIARRIEESEFAL